MKLSRFILSGVCLSWVPVASSQASPQLGDNVTVTVVRTSDEDAGQEKDSKDSKDSKDEHDKGDQKERKTLRLQLNNGPVVLMKRLALPADDQAKESADEDEPGKAEKTDDDKAQPPKIWLGIGLKEIEGDLATYLGSSEGVFIESIFPDSPAQEAKLREGDVVIAFQDEKVIGPADLVDALRAVKANEPSDKSDARPATYPSVTLTILRRGQELKIELTPRERPENLKVAQAVEADELLEGANIFKFTTPNGLKLNLDNSRTKTKTSVVVVVKEDGQEYIARIERDGDGPAKIVVTQDKKDRELREDQLDQLPEKVRDAIKRALKAGHVMPGAEQGSNEKSDANEQAIGEVQEQIERAMKQIGGGKIDLQWKGSPDANVIIIDPTKLQELGKLPEEAKAMAKKWAEVGAAQARGFSSMPEQVNALKKQVEDLRKEVDELREELKASKK